MLKIALFHNLPPGGARRYLYETTIRLSKKHIIDCYSLDFFNDRFYQTSKLCSHSYNFKFSLGNNFYDYLKNIYIKLKNTHKEIANQVNMLNYDIALVHPCIFTQAPFILKYLKIPKVYCCQEIKREFYEKTDFPSNSHFPLYKAHLVRLLRLPLKYIDYDNIHSANVVVANSKYTNRLIKKIYNIPSNIIYPGVNKSFFKDKKENRNILLSVGALNYLKGYHWIIKAIAYIPIKIRPLLLIIGYDGLHEKNIVQEAKKYRVKIKIIKKINDCLLLKYYNSSIAYLHGAYNEPFGLTILEAMSCKTPVISVNEGGATEIIKHGETGFLVSRSKPRLFAHYIKKLIKDKRIVEQLGRKSRIEVINKYSWENTTKHLELVLKSILEE